MLQWQNQWLSILVDTMPLGLNVHGPLPVVPLISKRLLVFLHQLLRSTLRRPNPRLSCAFHLASMLRRYPMACDQSLGVLSSSLCFFIGDHGLLRSMNLSSTSPQTCKPNATFLKNALLIFSEFSGTSGTPLVVDPPWLRVPS